MAKPSVLITGASSGIGAASAQALLARGWHVFGSTRDTERAARAQPAVDWLAADVRDEAALERATQRVVQQAGTLDALVCNAGIGIFGSVEEVPLDAARRQFETNFFGVLATLRAALPALRASRGRIVLVGSLAGRAPIPFQAHYSASKAAIDALALALRNEVAAQGIAVSLVEPGDIRTDFNERMEWFAETDSVYGEAPQRAARVIRASLPRAPGPEIVARVIVRALESRRPRVRYTIGPDARLVPLARRLLPDRISLRLIRSHFDVGK